MAAAIACQTNDDLMGNEMESGWVRQWPSGRLFGDPPKTPKPKWLPPVPPPPGELPQLTELKQKLAANFGRVLDLFKKWDVDHDHTISIDELRLALGALQVHADEKALRVLFTELDADASGAIDYEELYQALRTHGAKREVPDNRITLEMPSRKEPNPDGTLAERRAVAFLKKALHNNLDRVRDIFAARDFDGNGMISKRELQRGLAALSIAIDPRSIDILFEKLDADGSGGIEFKELNRYLRREFVFESEIVEARRITPMGGVPVAPSPEAAALGLIGSVSAPVLAPTRPQLGAQSSAAARRAATSGKRQPRMSARTQFEMRMARGDHALVRDLMKDRDDAIREQAAEARRRGGGCWQIGARGESEGTPTSPLEPGRGGMTRTHRAADLSSIECESASECLCLWVWGERVFACERPSPDFLLHWSCCHSYRQCIFTHTPPEIPQLQRPCEAPIARARAPLSSADVPVCARRCGTRGVHGQPPSGRSSARLHRNVAYRRDRLAQRLRRPQSHSVVLPKGKHRWMNGGRAGVCKPAFGVRCQERGDIGVQQRPHSSACPLCRREPLCFPTSLGCEQ